MVTGIETAGLVLGAFPLVIECLKYYISSAGKVKEMRNHQDVLRQLMREVRTEMTIFRTTWKGLLKQIGEDPYAPSDSLAEKLENCLEPDSISSIVDTCEGLNDILEELMQKFEKYEKNRAGISKMIYVTFSLTEEYRNTQMLRINRLNSNLDKLVNGALSSLAPEAAYTKVNSPDIELFKRIREHARVIHNALKENMERSGCGCNELHFVNLQLQMSFTRTAYKRPWPDRESKSLVRFSVFFSIGVEQERKWREFELEHLENFTNTADQLQIKTQGDEKQRNCRPAVYNNEATGIRGIEHMGTRYISSSTSALCSPIAKAGPTKMAPQNLMASFSNSAFTKMKRQTLSPQRSAVSKSTLGSRSPSPQPWPSKGILTLNTQRKPKRVSFQITQNPSSSIEREPTPPELLTNIQPSYKFADRTISCLCSCIHAAEEPHCCLGIFMTRDLKANRVWVPAHPLPVPSQGKAVTLAQLLALTAEHAPTLEQRLKLGVKLASSVLQLHDTEWLNERWSKEEIWFIQKEPCEKPVLECPLVRRVFKTQDTSQPAHLTEALIAPYNPSLFSLGIVLIELWNWKSVRAQNIGDAWMLLHELKGKAPASFSDAIRRCFGDLDHTDTNLQLEKFKNTVYQKIVMPLEDTVKWFCGKETLEQVFEEDA